MRQHAENLRSTLVPKRAKWCPGRDLNPHFPCEKKDFKSFASADFATRAEVARALHFTIIAHKLGQLVSQLLSPGGALNLSLTT